MSPSSLKGQALLEGAIVLLLVVTILVCSSRAVLWVFLSAKSESTAFQVALRHGRGLPVADRWIGDEVFGQASASEFFRRNANASPFGIELPVTLVGRTSSRVASQWREKAPDQTALAGSMRAPAGFASAELSCDPWDRSTRSGKCIENAVDLMLATGWIR